MFSDPVLLAVAILPVVALLAYIYFKDRYEREPLPLLLLTFAVGIGASLPAIVMEYLLGMAAPAPPVANALYNGFVVAAFSEETVKLVLLKRLIWNNRNFDEYFDGIVYAVFLSMGFACFENIMYVFGDGTIAGALATGAMRALLAVPAHFLFAVVMGYHFALAKFNREKRRQHLFLAWLLPLLLHGIYDSLLMLSPTLEENEGLSSTIMIVFVVFDILMWRWGMRRIRRLQQLSQEQHREEEAESSPVNHFSGFKWILLLPLLTASFPSQTQAATGPDEKEKTRVLLIVNCSHSMWDHWQSDCKIKVTQKVLLHFLDSIAAQNDIEVALRVFGHLNRGAYTTRLEVPFASDNNYALQSKIKTLVPNGGNTTATALTSSLDDFPLDGASRNIIVIITDGIDDSDGDICKVARHVQLSGIVVQTFILGIGEGTFHQADCAGTLLPARNEEEYASTLYDIFRLVGKTAHVILRLTDPSGEPFDTECPFTLYDSHTGVSCYNSLYTYNMQRQADTLQLDPLIYYDLTLHTHPPLHRDGLHFDIEQVNQLDIVVDEGQLRLRYGGNRPLWQLSAAPVVIRRADSGDPVATTVIGSGREATPLNLLSGRYDIEVNTLPVTILHDIEIGGATITDFSIPMPGMLILSKPKGISTGALMQIRNGQMEHVTDLNPNTASETIQLQPGQYEVVLHPQGTTRYDKVQTKRFVIESSQTTKIQF